MDAEGVRASTGGHFPAVECGGVVLEVFVGARKEVEGAAGLQVVQEPQGLVAVIQAHRLAADFWVPVPSKVVVSAEVEDVAGSTHAAMVPGLDVQRDQAHDLGSRDGRVVSQLSEEEGRPVFALEVCRGFELHGRVAAPRVLAVLAPVDGGDVHCTR